MIQRALSALLIGLGLAGRLAAADTAPPPQPVPTPETTFGPQVIGGGPVGGVTFGNAGSAPLMLLHRADAKPAPPQPWIGVSVASAPGVLLAQLRQPAGFGLVVDAVAPDSPAAKAGLAADDLLLAFDDQRLANAEQLRALIIDRGTERSATLHLLRGGEQRDVSLTAALHASVDAGSQIGDDFLRTVKDFRAGFADGEAPPLAQFFTTQGSAALFTPEHAIRLSAGPDGRRHIVVTPRAGGDAVYDGEFDPAHPSPAIPQDVAQIVGALPSIWSPQPRPAATLPTY